MDFQTHESGLSDAQNTRVANLPLLAKMQAKNGRLSTLVGTLRFLGIVLARACRLLERDARGEDVGVVFRWHAESIVCLELV